MAVQRRLRRSTVQDASVLLDCALPKRATRHVRLSKRSELEAAAQARRCIVEEGSLWSGTRLVDGVPATFKARLALAVSRTRQLLVEAWAEWRERSRFERQQRWAKRLQAHEARMKAPTTKPKPIVVHRFVDRFQCHVASA